MFIRRIQLFTVAGFKIGIDLSWFFIAILLSWSLAAGYFPYEYPHLNPGSYWLMGIIGMLGLFICVILHELGHAVVARHYHIPTTQITLFIFGGVAEIQKEPTTPKEEFFIAIAGPIVSFVLAILLQLLVSGEKAWGWPLQVIGVTHYLGWINFILALFNLIPAFPLDGGRILRAILWWAKKSLGWATKISTKIGSGFGLILIFWGILTLIFGNFISGFWLIILGWFLYRAASSMRTQYYIRKELEGEKVSKFMKEPLCVPPDISLQTFIHDYVYHSYHHLYPVTENDQLIGTISLKEAKTLSHQEWESTSVRKMMVPTSQIGTITPDTSALEALNMFQQSEHSHLLVVRGRHLVGLLTAQDLFKIISLKLELDEDYSQ